LKAAAQAQEYALEDLQYIADRYHSYCTKLAVSIARRFRIGLESRRGRSLLSMVLHGLIHAVSAAGSENGLHGLGQFSIRRRGRMVFHDGLCACDGAAAPSAGRFGLGEVDEEVLVEVRGNRVYHPRERWEDDRGLFLLSIHLPQGAAVGRHRARGLASSVVGGMSCRRSSGATGSFRWWLL